MTSGPTSFFWHDYETSGIDPARDRALQFAGRRTDADLNPIGEPLRLYCRPPEDLLPQPEACLVTGITPQAAREHGVPEPQFIARILAELGKTGTCGAGYNSIRFDDEFTRYTLYRNFHDPYEREWHGGNSRWDLIDVVRLCAALRPEGIDWPLGDNGFVTFKLEGLTAANGIAHGHAHDALSDVDATIDLARLLRDRQPKLFAHALALRSKHFAATQLNTATMTPVLHVSSKIAASRNCIALIVPIAMHPKNSNEVLSFDLSTDPQALIDLDAADLRERLFINQADLPDEVARIPLKGVHLNKSPMLAPLSVLRDGDALRLGLDLAQAHAHRDRLLAVQEPLAKKVREVFTAAPRDVGDPELSLYSGFLRDADKARCAKVRSCAPEQLAQHEGRFEDTRYNELLFRYRARNFADTLDADEHARWAEYRTHKLLRDSGLASITLPQYRERLAQLSATERDPARLKLLQALAEWPAEIGL
jgi:exodeoxyribonuclease-1